MQDSVSEDISADETEDAAGSEADEEAVDDREDISWDNDEEAPVLHVNAGIKPTAGGHYVATQTGVTVSQIFLGGSSKPHGQVRLVLDNLQRPYAWPKEYIEEVCRAVTDGYRNMDPKSTFTFGELVVYKDSDSDPVGYILNGQQRTTTIFLLLVTCRHLTKVHFPQLDPKSLKKIFSELLFQYEPRNMDSSLPRLQMHAQQAPFFASYIATAEDHLGCFWDETGRLQIELAGCDTILQHLMIAADIIKQKLEGAQGRSGASLFDDLDEVTAFVELLLDSVNMGWSEHIGGGQAHKADVYLSSNSQQLVTTAVDVLKANMLTNLKGSEPDQRASQWHFYHYKLEAHRLVCLGRCTMFEYVFHAIVWMLRFSGNIKEARVDIRTELTSEHRALNITAEPRRFMNEMFDPVAKALDRIFNWRDMAVTASRESGRYLDRIKTSCRALIAMANAQDKRPSMSYWLASCMIPAFIQLYPEKNLSPHKQKANFKLLSQLVQALKARVMWQWMCGEHPNKVLPILVAGGSISVSKSKQSPKRNVKGVLRILNPVGSIRQEWEHGCDVCDSLALTPLEKKALLTAILNIRYVHASDSNNAKVKQLLMVYDDELRNSVSGHGPYQSIDEFDYDAKLKAAEVPTKIHVCHLVPKAISRTAWKVYWDNGEHSLTKNLLGNLSLMTSTTNWKVLNKWELPDMLQEYSANSIIHFKSTDAIRSGQWTVDRLLARHKQVVETVARHYGIDTDLSNYLPSLASGSLTNVSTKCDVQ